MVNNESVQTQLKDLYEIIENMEGYKRKVIRLFFR